MRLAGTVYSHLSTTHSLTRLSTLNRLILSLTCRLTHSFIHTSSHIQASIHLPHPHTHLYIHLLPTLVPPRACPHSLDFSCLLSLASFTRPPSHDTGVLLVATTVLSAALKVHSSSFKREGELVQ